MIQSCEHNVHSLSDEIIFDEKKDNLSENEHSTIIRNYSEYCVDKILEQAIDCIYQGNALRFKNILDKTPQIIEKKFNGTYLLHLVCTVGKINFVNLLLFRGAEATLLNDDGKSPLHECVANKNYVILHLFVMFGISLNIQDKQGNTILHYAIGRNDSSLLEILFKYKVDPYVKNKNNKNSIDLASSKNKLKNIMKNYCILLGNPL